MESPQFSVEVHPALTLADTRISVIADNPPTKHLDDDVYDASQKWWKENGHTLRPNADWGGISVYSPPATLECRASSKPRLLLTPTALGHRLVDNVDSDIPQTASTTFSASITESAALTWNASVTAGVTFTVGLSVGPSVAKASASTAYSLSATVGHSVSNTRTIQQGTSEGGSITVPPRENALMVFFLQQGTLVFDLDLHWNRPGDVKIYTKPSRSPDGTESFNDWAIAQQRAGDAAAAAKYIRAFTVSLNELGLPDVGPAASITVPLASETETKVVAPLDDVSPHGIQSAIDKVLAGA